MLRVCGGGNSTSNSSNGKAATATDAPSCTASGTASFFSVDSRRKQVTLFDPAACGGTAAPEDRRVGVAAPKMFAFDAIFTQDDSQVTFYILNYFYLLLIYGRFLERKICNSKVYITDSLKKLRGSEQLYLTNVKTVLM